MSATIVEVAVDGPGIRKRQPRIPIAAKDIVAEAVACAKAGASIVSIPSA